MSAVRWIAILGLVIAAGCWEDKPPVEPVRPPVIPSVPEPLKPDIPAYVKHLDVKPVKDSRPLTVKDRFPSPEITGKATL